MSHLFDDVFDDLIVNEGGYSDHPYDPGGKTCWGITENLARDAGYTGHMQDMPLETAKSIYREHYWNSYFDQMDFRVAFNVFDACVNHGSSPLPKPSNTSSDLGMRTKKITSVMTAKNSIINFG